jgi:hypothetical protein
MGWIMRKVKIDARLTKRIDRGYQAIAKSNGKHTTEYEKQLLRLEKRLVERAFGIVLTEEEIGDLRAIVNVKVVFPGSLIVGVSEKRRFRKRIRA